MSKFENPLDNIRVASPCPANWDEMFGDDRRRFCTACKLNVYNLSGMTRREAENLLINSDGRLCVRYYRRPDGTVLTKDCPVGWQRIMRRVSRIGTAIFSALAGLFGGIFAFNLLREQPKQAYLGELTIDPKTVSHTLPKLAEIDGIQKIDPVETKGEYRGRVTMGKPAVIRPNTSVVNSRLALSK